MSSPPPVSLGKPSLRHRLESYYSLISPDAIADSEKWKNNFEIIYNKYGGTVEGETKLANKLVKKYGNQVRLLVAPPHRSVQRQLEKERVKNATAVSNDDTKHDESYYEIDESQKDTRVLDFTSDRFDALYSLTAPEGIVVETNPTIFFGQTMIQKLDNISKFRMMLPKCDPQSLDPTSVNKHASSAKNNNTTKPNSINEEKTKKQPMFLSMVSQYESKNSGPLSLLYSILEQRQRVRVMVRYADCIRGTITGYLIAFDKHFNMILKDVDEVYSGRITRHSDAVAHASGCGNDEQHNDCMKSSAEQNNDTSFPSKAKLEAQRRRCYPPDGSGGPGPAVKQRYFHQLMVRGDNVVMVWRAEAERSFHPLTNKSPSHSIYDHGKNTTSADGRDQKEIGTPGSLYFALQRWENQNGPPRGR